jgi:hypothetical protein
MNEISFEARVKATGLRPKPDDLSDLEILVKDLDRAAAHVRGPRSYAQEPLCAFRLQPAATPGGQGISETGMNRDKRG